MTTRPITLAQARAEGKDPLSLFHADRALLLDAGWLARVEAGAPLMFWGEDDDEGEDEDDHEPEGYTIEGNVGVVGVEGPIAQRGWFCVDGYDTIARGLAGALADSRCASVLLRLNSPGGAAAGAFEWTREMRNAVVASGKRVVAYADEMAFSGAYAVACVADEIVVPETGFVGSVGVIASMISRAKKNALDGYDVRVIRAGAEKADGHPDLPIDPKAVEREQVAVDRLAEIFGRWVGERRSMTVEAVAALEAGTRMGADAVASRLADRVQGYHALLAEMQARGAAQQRAGGMKSTAGNGITTTPAARAAHSTTRNNTMDEKLLAAVAALTGETDPEKQVSALGAFAARSAAAEKTITALTEEAAGHAARATAAETRLAEIERSAEVTAAKTAGQWSPALEPFLASLSLEQLKTWRMSAPRVVPAGSHQPPSDGPKAEGQLPPELAELAAKASEKGWSALTDAEKHRVMTANRPLADRLRAAAQG